MAFEIVILCGILAVANAGYLAPVPATHYNAAAPAFNVLKVANPSTDAVALTHQNVVRSFGGTVSQYSKSIQTPYSSVHKEDTRVSNNVYTPTVAKRIAYVAPIAPLHSAPVYDHQEPTHTVYASAAPHTVYTHEQPANIFHTSPAPTTAAAVFNHQNQVPSTATTAYNHGPAATTYTHSSPVVSAYGSSQTVQYSPANMVSRMTFDGFGTHWGY